MMIVVAMTMIWPHYWKGDLEAIGLGYIWIRDVRNDVGILEAVRQRHSNTGMDSYAE